MFGNRSMAGFIAAVLLLLSSCAGSNQYRDIPVEVTFLQLNDVYEIAPLEGGRTGGMARVAHIISEEKAQNPNTFAVVAGDFLSPSLLGTLDYKGETISGMQMIEVFNAAGIDWVTFGNHEFDLDRDGLQERIYMSQFSYVSSNVNQVLGNEEIPFQQMQGGKIVDIPRFREISVSDTLGRTMQLGLVGLTLPFNKQDYVSYEPVPATLSAMTDSLEDASAIVALTHLDIADDTAYARQFPRLSLIMGGHDHDNMHYKINGTTVAKADANAKSIYIHRMKLYPNGNVTIQSELKEITDKIPSDPATQEVVTKWIAVQERVFQSMGVDPDKILMTAPEGGLEGREAVIRRQPTNLGALIAQSLMYAAPAADAAILNSGSVRVDDVLSGHVTQFDVMRTLPFGGAVLEVEMSGLLLEKVLNVGRKNRGTGGFLQWADITVDSRRDMWMIKGIPIQPDKTYRIAMPEFLMTGMESNMSFLTPDNSEIVKVTYPPEGDTLRSDIRYAVMAYMEEKR